VLDHRETIMHRPTAGKPEIGISDTSRTIADLRPGDHLCCIYETEEGHRAVVTPFLRQGLEQGQKVIYIVDAYTAECILGYLRDEALDVDQYLARGQLVILTRHETYVREGVFDPERMIALLRSETERALAEGHPALRVTGEMAWALRGLPGSERLIEYEARLNHFLPGSHCLALCQYDRREFDPAVLSDVLRTHPIAVVGTEVYDNFYYIPAAEMLAGDLPAAELGYWLQNLAKRKQTQEHVRQQNEFLSTVLESLTHPFYVVDTRDYTVKVANPAARRGGLSEDKTCYAMTHGRDEPCETTEHPCPLEEMKRTKQPVVVEHLHRDEEGHPRHVEVYSYPILDGEGNVSQAIEYILDITERKRVEEALQQSERELTIRNAIANVFLTASDEEMYEQILQFIVEAMGSRYGVFGYIDEAGDMVAPSMTRDIWDECQIPDKDIVFPRETWGGIWGRAMIEKKTICSEGPFHVPEGHIPMLRAMAVPIVHQGELIGLIAVANKATDYDEKDRELLERIVDYVAPVLRARLQRDRQERERKRAEEEIRGLARFPSENPNPVLRIAKDGTILYANRASLSMLNVWGWQEGQPLPDDWRKLTLDVLGSGEREDTEVEVEDRILSLTFAPVVEADYVNVYGLDISERVWAEWALGERVKELICLYEVNRDMQEELPIDELCGRAIEHLVPAMQFPEITVPVIELEDRRFTSERYSEALSHGLQAEIRVGGEACGQLWVYYAEEKPFWIPEEQNLVNGVAEVLGLWLERRWAEEALHRAHDELEIRVKERTAELEKSNEALRVEIAERKRAEEALRASEERYRSLFDGVPVGLYRTTSDGQILDVNTALVRMLGYPDRESMLAVNPASIYVSPDVRERWQALIDREGVVRDAEVQVRRYDGTVIWVQDTARAIRGADPPLVYYEGAVEDITERRQAQAALLQAEQLAIAGKLAASLAHEINNPLQSVIGCLGLAKETLAEGRDVSRYIQVAHEELQRTARIVARLRDLHRASRREERKPTDVNGLLEQVLVLSRKQCEERGVDVVWETTTDLPPLLLAPDRMQQVFLNLLLNAIDAMPEGGRLQVRTMRTREPAGVRVAFTDSGAGIPPDVASQIFDPFYSTKPEGLGLGLFISRDIVERHGGRIEADSQAGEGTTFTVWLPA